MSSPLAGLNPNAPVFVPKFSSNDIGDSSLEKEEKNLVNFDKKYDCDDFKGSDKNEDDHKTSESEDWDDESSQVKEESALKSSKKIDNFEEKIKMEPPKFQVDPDKKEHVSVVFCGHVDAGKSTIGGNLLYLTGMVDKRSLEKLEKEAKDKNRDTWYLSFTLDTNEEEREKGKTVECGRGFFRTANKHFTLLDAPGHKSFVPNMISGAAQADLAVLVISARRGEFETGFEKGGQTREHAMLVKTAGTKHLIVLINKMDDPTVCWAKERFDECLEKLTPFLKKTGFNTKTDVYFMPCSGYTGEFLKDVPPESVCPWFRGPSFLDYIDQLPCIQRKIDGPLRMPINNRYKDMGTYVIGKIESGGVERGQTLVVMPNKKFVEVVQIFINESEVSTAIVGDNVKIKFKNIEEEDLNTGFVLCHPLNLCKVCSTFDAKVHISEHKSILCPGYTAIIHIHSCTEEVSIEKILCTLDRKNAIKTKFPHYVKPGDLAIIRFKVLGGLICMETYKDFPQLGRFTLRDEAKTIAAGTVSKIFQSEESSITNDQKGYDIQSNVVQ